MEISILNRAKNAESFAYMLLDRMRADCLYFLGNGNRQSKYLWGGSVKEHIDDMKALWNAFPENMKPEWLSMDEIKHFEEVMA